MTLATARRPTQAACFDGSWAGVSGAVLLLPVQISVLHVPNPALTPINRLYNVLSTPGALARFARERRLRSPLTRALLIGTIPGVLAYQALELDQGDGTIAPEWLLGISMGVGGIGGSFLGARLQPGSPRRRCAGCSASSARAGRPLRAPRPRRGLTSVGSLAAGATADDLISTCLDATRRSRYPPRNNAACYDFFASHAPRPVRRRVLRPGCRALTRRSTPSASPPSPRRSPSRCASRSSTCSAAAPSRCASAS